jgi:hypothetical protein
LSDRPILLGGLLLNSALYLVCVFVAGIVTEDGFTWRCAIAAMGATYVCYLVQLAGAPLIVRVAALWLSIALGVVAGASLLLG